MRRVCPAWHVVTEEGLAGIDLVEFIQPIDGVIRHAGDQVPAGLALERVDLRGIAEQVWLPLVRVTADEPVEILEAHADRPLIEGAGLARHE